MRAEWLVEATRPGHDRIFLVRNATDDQAKKLIAVRCKGFEVSVVAKFGEGNLDPGEPQIIEGTHMGNY